VSFLRSVKSRVGNVSLNDFLPQGQAKKGLQITQTTTQLNHDGKSNTTDDERLRVEMARYPVCGRQGFVPPD
jgi:hypothetical protein